MKTGLVLGPCVVLFFWGFWESSKFTPENLRVCEGKLVEVTRVKKAIVDAEGEPPILVVACDDGSVMTGGFYHEKFEKGQQALLEKFQMAADDGVRVKVWQDHHDRALLGVQLGDEVLRDGAKVYAQKRPFGWFVSTLAFVVFVLTAWNRWGPRRKGLVNAKL